MNNDKIIDNNFGTSSIYLLTHGLYYDDDQYFSGSVSNFYISIERVISHKLQFIYTKTEKSARKADVIINIKYFRYIKNLSFPLY